MGPTVGDTVYCWPERFDPAERPELAQHAVEGADGKPALRCAGIVCAVLADVISVHYFLPDGANGAQRFPAEPSLLERGRWWQR